LSQIETCKQVKKPESEAKIRVYENKKETLEEQIKDKKLEMNGTDPYQTLLDEAKGKFIKAGKEVSFTKEEISNLNTKTKYFEFWSQAFGDSGIRKYVIDEIVPALNNNINYWMQFLIEGNMQINFNNEFEETILKAPSFKDDIQYYALSSGQKRRVNLALSQSFAHVMSLNSGRTPNLVFLDEVTSNIDLQGVGGIISMIQEIAKEKQVWLITHHHDLLDALQSTDSVNLELKNGVSTIVGK
jgi:DNA repair exonuclease SbcCD ATPase subunit